MSRTATRTFGRIAVDKGYLEPDALTRVLDQQKEMADRQVLARLGELLLLVGQLNVDQLFDVLDEQLKRVRVCHGCDQIFRVARPKSSSQKKARCPRCGERMEAGAPPSRDQVKADITRLKGCLTRIDRKELARIKNGRFARPSKVKILRSASQKALSGGHRKYRPAAGGPPPRKRPAKLASVKRKRPMRRPSMRFSLKEVKQARRKKKQVVAPPLAPAEPRSKRGAIGLLLLVCLCLGVWRWKSSPAPAPAAEPASVNAVAKVPAVEQPVTQAAASGRLVLVDGELALETGRTGRIWLVGNQQRAFDHMRRFLESGGKAVYLHVRGGLISEDGDTLIDVAQWRRTPAAPGRLEIEQGARR